MRAKAAPSPERISCDEVLGSFDRTCVDSLEAALICLMPTDAVYTWSRHGRHVRVTAENPLHIRTLRKFAERHGLRYYVSRSGASWATVSITVAAADRSTDEEAA